MNFKKAPTSRSSKRHNPMGVNEKVKHKKKDNPSYHNHYDDHNDYDYYEGTKYPYYDELPENRVVMTFLNNTSPYKKTPLFGERHNDDIFTFAKYLIF